MKDQHPLDNSSPIDPWQAYAAANRLLEQWYKEVPSDEVGLLLGAMSTGTTGRVADNGVWRKWQLAVEAARAGSIDISGRQK
jgi:hypothetical protein